MKIAAAILGAALLVAGAGTSNAQEIVFAQPLGLVPGGIEVLPAAFGCGPGFIPNRFGVCRPRFYGPRFYGYGRPYGYGYGYRRFGYGYRRGFY